MKEIQKYLPLEILIDSIEQPYQKACVKLLETNYNLFKTTPGSIKNHQAYSGGYIHHLEEVMNIAIELYATLSALRELPFSLSDSLLVLYLHDIEKPWKYEKNESGELIIKESLYDKEAQYDFQLNKASEYGIELTDEHKNALQFINGEGTKYTYYERTRGPLAAFCGACDAISARIWFDYPKVNDSWKNL